MAVATPTLHHTEQTILERGAVHAVDGGIWLYEVSAVMPA